MSFRRKNSRRLRDLRQRGMPIDGDYRTGVTRQGFKLLEEALGHAPRVLAEFAEDDTALVYLDPKEQRTVLASLAK